MAILPPVVAPAAASPPPAPKPPPIGSTKEFFLDDFPKTLFTLKTNRELVIAGEPEITSYITKCLDGTEDAYSFLPQKRVYGAKPRRHLRRTVKLDAVAEYYIYDVVYRNRALFRKPHSAARTHYGYRFEGGAPIPATSAYKAFKGAIADYSAKLPHHQSFDVASYFNSVYHHDLVHWLAELGANNQDVDGFGQLLREIAAGRSVDCLPQGLYPSKMIGNDFLRFIDNYSGLASNQLVRFMDDFYLFAQTEQAVEDDFQVVQRLLGEKGLSVNPQKTGSTADTHADLDKEIDQAKATLLKRRRFMLTLGYDENDNEIIGEALIKWPLTDKELGYIAELLGRPKLEEEDAELILTIMRDHANLVEARLPYLISTFPNLAKNVYGFCAGVKDKELIATAIFDIAKSGSRLMEFQLFWFGAILEDFLMTSPRASSLISLLYNHPSATVITRAKILEIADTRFGLPELRNDHLNTGQSDWLAWASAVGSRTLNPASRNYKLKYFGKSSPMNHLVATVVAKM